MSEYVLKDLVIDRCQICNAVWLDNEEFEKVMNATPDLRRRYDEAVRKREQMRMEALATSHSHRLSLAEKDPEDGSALGDLICFLLFDD
jgi:Zn-finger nucleic acid-binding protein